MALGLGDASRYTGFDVLRLELAPLGHHISPFNHRVLNCRRLRNVCRSQVRDLAVDLSLSDQVVFGVHRHLSV